MNESTANFDNVLRIGRFIRLVLAKNQEVSESKNGSGDSAGVETYGVQIQDLLPDKIVVIWPSHPKNARAQISVTKGQKTTLEIKNRAGTLRLDSKIVDTVPDAVPLLHIARSGDWSRSQLRDNVRLELTLIPTEACVLWRPPKEADDSGAPVDPPELGDLLKMDPRGEAINTVIRDLSAGGALLGVSTHLRMGSIVKIKFAINPEQPDLTTYAKVVWIGQDEAAIRHSHEAGCQFLNLSTKQQDMITKFIFAKEVEFRRRGLM